MPLKTAGRRARGLTALALCAVAALVLSGCNWTGKGKDVAQAIERTASFKSRAFAGTIDVKTSGDASKSFAMTFSGASDNRDPANPKMTMSMTIDGSRVGVTMPGDGYVYIVSPTGSYGAPVPATDRSKTAIDSSAIYEALGKAIGHFETSQPMQNARGQDVPTIAAKVSRGKLCSDVLPAFGDVMSKASAGGGAGSLPAFTGGGSLGQLCKMMLLRDPRVWFGIDNGVLTDVALNADLAFVGVGAMSIEVQYHEYDQGKDQPSIKKPVGAQMLPSLQAIAPQQGATAGQTGSPIPAPETGPGDAGPQQTSPPSSSGYSDPGY